MPFVCRPGLNGRVYIPEPVPGAMKKNRCESCFACQACSNDRCNLCLSRSRSEATVSAGTVRGRTTGEKAGAKQPGFKE